MLLFDLLLPLILGLAAGLVFRRDPRSLSQLQPHHIWLLWLAAVVQLSEYFVPALKRLALAGDRGAFTAAIFLCVAGCLWLNAVRFSGVVRLAWLTVGIGAVLNAVPLALNGTMPFSRSAAASLGASPQATEAILVKNGVAHPGTHFAWLGDILPLPPLHVIVSVGDLAVCLGLALLVFAAMSPRRAPATSG